MALQDGKQAEALRLLIAAELLRPVDPRVTDMAAALAAQHHGAARAVLFYGSCLRQRELDGLMLDFYLIVSTYREAYRRRWLRLANRMLPPNVFPFEHDGLVAKYAVLSEADFARENSGRARSVSVWARFAQPSRLVWVRDLPAQERVVAAVAAAPVTLFDTTLPTLDPEQKASGLAVFRAGFALTYGAELRSERKARASSIVESDPEYFQQVGDAVLRAMPPSRRSRRQAQRDWRCRRLAGKTLTLLRLAKASATFAGGIDYLAWKINRHAGTSIEIKPWQRRWPLIGAVILLPRLLKRGAIR